MEILSRRLTDRKSLVLLICISITIFINTLWNPFIWDDYLIIVNNPLIKEWNLLQLFPINGTAQVLIGGWYRPLMLLTYSLDYHIWGLNTFGFHLTNLIIHTTSGVLVYLITKKLVSNRLTSFLAALLFLVHPIQTEAVSYISGRADLLLVMFLLMCVWLLEKAYFSKEKSEKNRYYIFSILLFIAGLLSKETAIIFPILVPVFFFSFLEEKITKNLTIKLLLWTLPFLSISFVYAVVRFISSKNWLIISDNANIYKNSLLSRIVMFLKAFFIYIKNLIIPLDLHYRTETILNDSISDPRIIFSIVALLVLIFMVVKFWKTKRSVSFGIAWFLVSLVPISNVFVPLNFVVGLRWIYLGSVGFFVALASLVEELFFSMKRKVFKDVLAALLLIYLFSLSFLAIKRNVVWGNPISFFMQILQHDPNNYKIHHELGLEYKNSGDVESAIQELKKSIDLNPGPPYAYYNLGLIYANKKDYQNSIKYLEIAANKDLVSAFTKLASVYASRGNYDKALEWLEKLSHLLPNSWKVYSQIGDVYYLKGDFHNAKLMWLKALKIKPGEEGVSQKLKQLQYKK